MGKVPLQGLLEGFAGLETDGLRSLDLNHFPGPRISTRAGLPVADGKSTETHQPNVLSILERATDRRERCVDSRLGLGLRHTGLPGYTFNQISFCHQNHPLSIPSEMGYSSVTRNKKSV